jgi:hypothetical protein
MLCVSNAHEAHSELPVHHNEYYPDHAHAFFSVEVMKLLYTGRYKGRREPRSNKFGEATEIQKCVKKPPAKPIRGTQEHQQDTREPPRIV